MHRTQALALRLVPYGEADLVATLFTRSLGLVSAWARSARVVRSRPRVVLEPMHTLSVVLRETQGRALFHVSSASILLPRARLTARLGHMQAAGTALRWIRDTTAPRAVEASLWGEVNRLLDTLDAPECAAPPALFLAEAGLRFLEALGYGLVLDRCVRCGRACQPERAAHLDPARGGLVCTSCGGSRTLVDAHLRARMLRAARAPNHLEPDDAEFVLAVVEEALVAHARPR